METVLAPCDQVKHIDECLNLNRQLKLLMDSSSNVFLLLDPGTNLIWCSSSALNLMGVVDASDVLGKPLHGLFDPSQNENFLWHNSERLIRLMAGQDWFVEDDMIHWPTVGERFYRITCRRLHDMDGELDRILMILDDVTEVQVEEAERRVNDMMNTTLLPCMVWDMDGDVISCNKEVYNTFGIPEGALPNEFGIRSIQPKNQPDGRNTEEIRQEFIRDVIANGLSRKNILLTRLNGKPIYFEASAARISWRTGYRLVVYFNDLTNILAREAEAKEAEERVRIMLDSTPLICILRDENNNVIDCNQEALNLFKVSHKSDFINNFHDFYPEFQSDGRNSIEKIRGLLCDLLEGDKEKIKFEWVFQSADGEHLPVETIVVRIMWKGVRRCLSYSRDLREEKANEKKMRENAETRRKLEIQNEASQAASLAKSQFLASMSHEIRTPMNTIIGLLDLMRTDNLDEQQVEYIKDIKRTSDSLLHIINDILDIHRIESGKLEIIPFHFNLNTLFNDLVSRHKFLAETKGLTFTYHFAPDLPRSLLGDELRISQIATNLISNAIKYTQKGFVNFHIDSVTEDGKEFIAFAVEDSGIGISDENFSSLFEKFEQFDKNKNRGIQGTGLGLSIAKSLAELMGGYIRFRSEYCKGSVFTFFLPMVEGDLQKIENDEVIERVIASPDAKVLVVDDNPGNITVASGLLARHGIIPQTAGTGIEAIQMIQSHHYDLVFMDHMMPEMDGVEATEIIRKMEGEYYRALPIVALSANAVVEAREQFIKCGMNDFVSKPIIGNDLNRALSRWLPPNKIVKKETGSEITEPSKPSLDESELNQLLQELTKIEDLSITSGLSRVGGDKKLYIDVLRQFSQGTEEDIEMLNRCVKDNLWKAYGIRVHAVKSVLATVGNKFLADWALRLEEAATQDNTDMCVKENHNFCTALTKFHTKLLKTDLMADVATIIKKKKITHKELKTKLELLQQACDEFQPETAEPIAKDILGVTLDAPVTLSTAVDAALKEINGHVQSFDYDKVTESIGKLLKIL